MAKVTFKRYETDAEAQASNIVDGQFIVTKEGTSYIDYGEDRVSTNGTRDTAMSDTSQNAVQNKVIKEYVDDGIQEAKDYTDEKQTYSTTETVIGTWLGKPLYRKVVDCGALPNATAKNVAHGISNLSRIIKMYGNATDGTNFIDIPNVHAVSFTSQVAVFVQEANIRITAGSDRSGYNAYMVLEYTKTTD